MAQNRAIARVTVRSGVDKGTLRILQDNLQRFRANLPPGQITHVTHQRKEGHYVDIHGDISEKDLRDLVLNIQTTNVKGEEFLIDYHSVDNQQTARTPQSHDSLVELLRQEQQKYGELLVTLQT